MGWCDQHSRPRFACNRVGLHDSRSAVDLGVEFCRAKHCKEHTPPPAVKPVLDWSAMFDSFDTFFGPMQNRGKQ